MNAQIKKGILEMCILHVISGEDLYGYDIIQKAARFFFGSDGEHLLCDLAQAP